MRRLYRLLGALVLALSLSVSISCGNSECVDDDGDDHGDNCSEGIDCDDHDRSIFEEAPELCDGHDNQCPGDHGYGVVDEGCP